MIVLQAILSFFVNVGLIVILTGAGLIGIVFIVSTIISLIVNIKDLFVYTKRKIKKDKQK